MLSRKDQVNTKEDNKDIQMLKDEIWTRQQIIANVIMIRKNQVVEETTLLEEIWQNGTKEQEVIKELEKEDSQSWEDNSIVYIEEKIYIPNNKKIMNLWILNIQNNKGCSNWSKGIIGGQR